MKNIIPINKILIIKGINLVTITSEYCNKIIVDDSLSSNSKRENIIGIICYIFELMTARLKSNNKNF